MVTISKRNYLISLCKRSIILADKECEVTQMINYGLENKVAIITGANNPQGIGATTALALAREGAKVVLVYKKVQRPFDPNKIDANGVDRYYAANAGDAAAVECRLQALGADYLILERDISDEAAVKHSEDS